MKLYHGSTIDIKNIDLSKSKPNKDFGKGFYLSDSEQQAYEMAKYKSMQLNMPPVISVFEFNEKILEGDNEFKIKMRTNTILCMVQ